MHIGELVRWLKKTGQEGGELESSGDGMVSERYWMRGNGTSDKMVGCGKAEGRGLVCTCRSFRHESHDLRMEGKVIKLAWSNNSFQEL